VTSNLQYQGKKLAPLTSKRFAGIAAQLTIEACRKRMRILSDAPQTAFDIRNPTLASTFHKFKDEVAGTSGYSAAQIAHQAFINQIEADYKKYLDLATGSDTAAEQVFDALVEDMTDVLINSEKKVSDSSDPNVGVKIGLVIVLRVVFGSGPAFSEAIHSAPGRTTLAILARVLTVYDERTATGSQNAFGRGVSWSISEFCRRCEEFN
jgi:hypothetical protein